MNVTNLADYKESLIIKHELARERTPLYVSHLTGKVSGSSSPEPDFGNRLQRIRSSLEKINRLMTNLKELETERSTDVR